MAPPVGVGRRQDAADAQVAGAAERAEGHGVPDELANGRGRTCPTGQATPRASIRSPYAATKVAAATPAPAMADRPATIRDVGLDDPCRARRTTRWRAGRAARGRRSLPRRPHPSPRAARWAAHGLRDRSPSPRSRSRSGPAARRSPPSPTGSRRTGRRRGVSGSPGRAGERALQRRARRSARPPRPRRPRRGTAAGWRQVRPGRPRAPARPTAR